MRSLGNTLLKLLVGLVTASPLLVAIYIFYAITSGQLDVDPGPETHERLYQFNALNGWLSFALVVSYVAHALFFSRVERGKRWLRAVVLVLGNVFAMPVYWFLHVWRVRAPETADSETDR